MTNKYAVYSETAGSIVPQRYAYPAVAVGATAATINFDVDPGTSGLIKLIVVAAYSVAGLAPYVIEVWQQYSWSGMTNTVELVDDPTTPPYFVQPLTQPFTGLTQSGPDALWELSATGLDTYFTLTLRNPAGSVGAMNIAAYIQILPAL